MDTTHTQQETVEEASVTYLKSFPTNGDALEGISNTSKAIGFIDGAKWQAKQDKAIMDELVDVLKMELWALDNGEYEAQQQGKPRLTERIEKIKSALQKLKP